MSAPPKDKSATRGARPERPDHTSAVVTTTLVGLALLGAATIFWEPLTAFALGAPAADGVGDSHPTAPNLPAATGDAGAAAPALPADASGNS
jgi:hypothetical protein